MVPEVLSYDYEPDIASDAAGGGSRGPHYGCSSSSLVINDQLRKLRTFLTQLASAVTVSSPIEPASFVVGCNLMACLVVACYR